MRRREGRVAWRPALRGCLPFGGAADRWHLPRRRRAGRGNGSHRFQQFPPRAGWRRRGAAFVEAAAIFQSAVRVIAEEVGRADGGGHFRSGYRELDLAPTSRSEILVNGSLCPDYVVPVSCSVILKKSVFAGARAEPRSAVTGVTRSKTAGFPDGIAPSRYTMANSVSARAPPAPIRAFRWYRRRHAVIHFAATPCPNAANRPARPAPIQLPLFAEAASLIRVRPERNEWRFYRLGDLARPVRPRPARPATGAASAPKAAAASTPPRSRRRPQRPRPARPRQTPPRLPGPRRMTRRPQPPPLPSAQACPKARARALPSSVSAGARSRQGAARPGPGIPRRPPARRPAWGCIRRTARGNT